jgi:hypothetical protein
MSFIVASCALLLALLSEIVLDFSGAGGQRRTPDAASFPFDTW